MKIVSIVGARPQFIKLAPVAKTARLQGHEHIVIHTGQHYDYEMSKVFFDQLEIAKPDHSLEIGSGTHAWQTGQMLSRIGETLSKLSPDLTLVFGDTNSTLAGALAAVKLHIPVGHVEAGYRSGDISMPEEINRIITDRISQILFAPTEDAIENLVSEGVDRDKIFFVGNIMAETLLSNLERVAQSDILKRLELTPKSYGVLTAHRPENTNDPQRFERIFDGIIAADYPIVFPVHPRTSALLESYGLTDKLAKSKIKTVSPMNYIEFAKLQSEAALILTDSGGVQEEAILLGVPCLTLRYNTERILTLEMGANKLVGADDELIRKNIIAILDSGEAKFSAPLNWDTGVSSRIMEAIEAGKAALTIKPEVADLSKGFNKATNNQYDCDIS